MNGPPSDVTLLLDAMGEGDEDARNRLVELVYDDLRSLADGYLRRERADHTLQATSLVSEAWLRLGRQDRVQWKGRSHFLGIAAQAMRRVLVDHHRRRMARGGRLNPVTLMDIAHVDGEADPVDLQALDRALDELGNMDPRAARVVELRFFGGLTVEECAEVMGVSAPTIKRDWRAAKAWLYREMSGDPGTGSEP